MKETSNVLIIKAMQSIKKKERWMVNWSEHTKCSKTTQDKTKASKAPIDKV